MHSFFQKILFFLARRVLKKYRPDVVGITGSVGKTSTRDAVAAVLARHFRVRASAKSFNNAFGVPFTILGIERLPGRSVARWLGIFAQGVGLLFFRNRAYPQILVLEMGADAPGDIAALVRLAPCSRGVVTAISPVHLEKYGSFEALEREKKQMYAALGSEAIALVPIDDEIVSRDLANVRARVMTYGRSESADIRLTNCEEHYAFTPERRRTGISFDLHYNGSSVRVDMPHAIGTQFATAALCAASVGISYGMPLGTIAEQLCAYRTPRGRMRLIDGVKGTLVIDDTYNSSPKAVLAALETLANFEIDPDARRIAVLGDMLELGEYSQQAHEDIGTLLKDYKVDFLLAVGPFSRHIAEGARQSGIDEGRISWFDTAMPAGLALQQLMRRNDVILIKGSQGIRLERVVKEVMAEPQLAEELLVRQEPEWK